MSRNQSTQPSRRDFIGTSALGLAALAAPLQAVQSRGANVIFINLVGGPSHLDTWDMKPDAPSEYRGPFRPISTNVDGVQVSEIFPRLARRADRYAILRTLHHDGPAVHDTGHQLMQTGRLFGGGAPEPHMGCVAGAVLGSRKGAPAHAMLPGPIGNTGGNLRHGQDAAYLGTAHDPILPDMQALLLGVPQEARRRYGLTPFGRNCLCARRLVERGARFVTVNMFDTVFEKITWDIHGVAPFSPIDAYRDRIGPMFDQAFSALLDDLDSTGELDNTLVVAAGEFGRTPKINPVGGRDHWTQCWSILMAGGGVKGGQVIGASDARGLEPRDRPIKPAELVASVYHAMGIPADATVRSTAGESKAILDPGIAPIRELFA